MRTPFHLLTFGLATAATGCASWRPEPLVEGYGLGHVIHPLVKPIPAVNYHATEDRSGKDHVYVFVINGADPLCLGNLDGMCDYLRGQGYAHTYFAQPYTRYWFPDEIREVRQRDPDAKIVVIGFSWGCNDARSMVNGLNKDGVPVNLLVYLGGDFIWNTKDSSPPNVRRVVNIRAHGLLLLAGLADGADIDGARNERIDCRHIQLPSRQQTLELLTEELNSLAGGATTPGLPTNHR